MPMVRAILARLSRRPVRVLLPILVLLLLYFTLSRTGPPTIKTKDAKKQKSPYYKAKTKSFFPPSPNAADFCANFPKNQLKDVQVVLKTGAGEHAKSKAHLATVGSCISNLLIVSDHEEKIGEHVVTDILAELPPSYAINNSDFNVYLKHKKAHIEGDTIDFGREGWRLDRFKFLPMVDKAYEVNPKAKWYVFLESDIYFFWDTLFRLLDQLDPDEAHYMGAQNPAHRSNGRNFAYGGAGFVLSGGLMRKLLPGSPGDKSQSLALRYEQHIKNDCCGDAVLAYAILNTTETKLSELYPTFSSEDLREISVDRDRWCVPLLSLHRVGPEQMEKLWKWERTRPYTTKPFVYSSLLAYTHSFLPKSPVREWWDNLSVAPVPNDRPAHRNAGSCGSECGNDAHCLQWSYSQTVCRFAPFIKLGNEVDKNNGGQGEFVSGWELGKMGQLGFKTGEGGNIFDTCAEATWLVPQVK